jgi:protein TonB
MSISGDVRGITNGGANGASHAPARPYAVAAGAPYFDPMSKVLGLDAKTSSVTAWFGFTSAGTLALVWLMAMALVVAWWRNAHATIASGPDEQIEILRDDPPPPPPPLPQETKVEPAVAPPPKAHEAPPPPPAPAQAAKVLTQETKPDEPIDLTGNTIVQGNADSFAGGFTAGNGTNANAVKTMPSPTGVPGGTGAPQAPAPSPPPKVSKARAASLGGGSEWSCPFPAEADTAQVDEAVVMIEVDVRADGGPAGVKVLRDPGNGFGREARRCAMSRRYSTALDDDGNPIAGTFKVNVRFSR